MEIDQILCLLPGKMKVKDKWLHYVIVVGNSGMSVWIQKTSLFESLDSWSSTQVSIKYVEQNN